ncbi:hypothetical protein BDN72DRAFT_792826 [Pluteus cervinus]|uniref:Uncharacterized protein n=1 Tax=Pluteus cervinus TaxID=181527 RepID=A0ACD3B317_9AGAR|nr:hypothetical protein BDN72DRAFT_792826 [Pluteus cervinus]
MQNSGLSRQVRTVLEKAPDCLSASDLLALVDEFVLDCSPSPDAEAPLAQLEEELALIHHDVVDHTSLVQTETFLAVLYHLGPILPPTSVISWFDVVLRPALREPKLSSVAASHAKELIISSLQKDEEKYSERVSGFRRRLFDLYLLDAFNEGSGEDILELAELDEEQRARRTLWKANLEDILLRYGNERPQDLLTEINIHFTTPSARLQLLLLLNLHTSASTFEASAKLLAAHPLMTNLLYSLLLDNSSTLCTAILALVVKLLPIFAVHSSENLKSMLPTLLAILARLVCWSDRHPTPPSEDDPIPEFERSLDEDSNKPLEAQPDLHWQKLEMSFGPTSAVPSPRSYYTALYYLYPSNLIKFLRGPVQYLVEKELPSPYTVGWDQAVNDETVRRKCEAVLREHVCHPNMIWRDSIMELSVPEFWSRYSVARIASEACMLDARNTALGIREAFMVEGPTESSSPAQTVVVPHIAKEARSEVPESLATSSKVISLTDMISTSLTLKSNLDVEITKLDSQWPQDLFQSSPSPSISLTEQNGNGVASPVAQAILNLQREVLLLRSELNFEQWLSRENAKHIGRLYQDRTLIKTAEVERQGLYNKLRRYRMQVITLENELHEHKVQASSAKNKYADWNTELQKKLRELRDEKKTWLAEAGKLRSAEKEIKALFDEQGKLLGKANEEVFQLRTQYKANEHKIDRLKDYEQRIEQHVKMQRLWQFNERVEQITLLQSQMKQMQLRVESYEQSQATMEEQARAYRRQIQGLEARFTHLKRKSSGVRLPPPEFAHALAEEKLDLQQKNIKLREENKELKDEVEELTAMMEVLKADRSGRRGLISEPRSSPLLYS